MISLLSQAFLYFRPDDDSLSQGAASNIQVHRVLTALGAVLASVFAPLYAISSSQPDPLVWAPLGMVGLYAGLLGLSYSYEHVRRNYVKWLRGLLYVVMAWSVLITALRDFDSESALGLLLAYAVLLAVVGYGARSIAPVLWFSGVGMCLTVVAVVAGPSPQTSPMVLVPCMAAVALTESIVAYGQQATREKLRKREARLRTINENVSEGIYRSTPEDGLVYANRAFATMFGFDSVEALLELDPATLYADPAERERLRALLREQRSFDAVEVELRRRDGTTFPALLSGKIVRDDGGEVIYYDGAVRDVTEVRRHQQEMERRSDAMEAASDGIAIMDREGTYRYVNQALADIYGYDAPEPFVGTTWKVCYGEEELRRFEDEVMPTLFEEGEWRGEARGLRADGSSFPQELTLTTLEEGGVVSVVRDITEQKKVEQALREERNRFETLFENLPTPVAHGQMEKNRRVWVQAVNEAFEDVFGVEAAAAEGEEVDALLVPEGEQENAVSLNRRAVEEGMLRTEVRRKTAEGMRDFRLQVATRRREEGPPEAYAIYTDITERKQRERELRERERQLQQIRENVTDVVWMSVPDERAMEFVSKAYEDVWGRSTQELKEHPASFLEGVHPDDRARVLSALDVKRTSPKAYEETYRVVHPDGEVRWVHDRSAGVYDEEGQLERIVGVATDITEQKRREKVLEDRQDKVESLYGASSHLLTTEDTADVAERIHDVLRQVFEYALTGITLAHEGRLRPERMELEDGRQMPAIQSFDVDEDNITAIAYRDSETVVVEDVRELDNPIEYGDLGSVASVPIGDHGAIMLGRVETGPFDPFDLRLIEILAAHATAVLDGLEQLEALQESEQRFRRIFENAAIGIAVLGESGHLIEVNPALRKMTGYDAGELEGDHFERLSHPDDVESDVRRYQELVAGDRRRYQMEKRYVRKDGTVFWGRLTVSRHDGGEKGRVIGMVEDIDDQKRYEEELRAAKEEAERMNRLKSAFLANMSHEIRTPLTSIIGFAEAIGEEVEEMDASEHEMLGRFSGLIKRGGQRLMETLDAVMNLSKLEAGEMELVVEPLDLVAEAEDAIELFDRQAEEAEIDLRLDTDCGSVCGRADEGGLRIALRNLLSNAIKYTEAGGTVWLRAREERDAAVLEVEDTGVGMDPDRVSELFEAFKQESEGVGREYEGSGLGLAVTKRVIDQMEGAIEVETEQGVGTRFTVRLPADSSR